MRLVRWCPAARRLTAVVLVVVLLAGCGGGGDGQAAKRRFVAAGNRICDAYPQPLMRVFVDGAAPGRPLSAIAVDLARRLGQLVQSLRGLQPPAGRDGAGAVAVAQALLVSLQPLVPAAERLRAALPPASAFNPADGPALRRADAELGGLRG